MFTIAGFSLSSLTQLFTHLVLNRQRDYSQLYSLKKPRTYEEKTCRIRKIQKGQNEVQTGCINRNKVAGLS